MQTLSVALSRLSITSQVALNEMMAGLVITSLPMIVVFLIFEPKGLADWWRVVRAYFKHWPYTY